MSDDIVNRLTAELAAERERVLNMHVSLIRLLEKRCDDAEELAAIRPEIDKLRERLGPRGLVVVEIGDGWHYVSEKVADEIKRLRAELAAERERMVALRECYDGFLKSTGFNTLGDVEDVLSERDALRELLREVRPYVDEAARAWGDNIAADHAADFLTRIDTLLKGGRNA